MYDGKPLAADRIPWKWKHTDEMLEDARKDKYMKALQDSPVTFITAW